MGRAQVPPVRNAASAPWRFRRWGTARPLRSRPVLGNAEVSTDAVRIPLSGNRGRGRFALVDPEDAERVIEAGPWNLSDGYAATTRGSTTMHRFVMRTDSCSGLMVVRLDGDRLNNTRANLRVRRTAGDYLGHRCPQCCRDDMFPVISRSRGEVIGDYRCDECGLPWRITWTDDGDISSFPARDHLSRSLVHWSVTGERLSVVERSELVSRGPSAPLLLHTHRARPAR